VMLCSDREIKIVTKPWGFEFELFDNHNVSLWILVMGLEHKSGYLYEPPTTSEHLHVQKTAIVIPLVGNVVLIKDGHENEVAPMESFAVERRVFHRLTTKGTSAICLEVEFPSKRGDIIRKSDHYGRLSSTYEWDLIGQELTSAYTSELRSKSCKDMLRISGSSEEPCMKIGDRIDIQSTSLDAALKTHTCDPLVIITNGQLQATDGSESIQLAGDVSRLEDLRVKLNHLKKTYVVNALHIDCMTISATP